MIINVNESKKIDFDVSISGIQLSELKGSLKFTIDDIEYGFPINITENNIQVVIPSLNNVLPNLKENISVKAELNIIAGDTYLTPWNDIIKIENPPIIKVKKANESITKPIIPIIEIKKVDTEKIIDKKEKKIKPEKKSKINKFLSE